MPHPPPGKNSTDAAPPETTSPDNSSAPPTLPASATSADASAPASFPETSAACPARPSISPDCVSASPAPPAPEQTPLAARKIAGESGSALLPGKSSSNTPPFFCDTFPRTPAPPHGTPDQSFAPPAPPAPGSPPTASGPIPTEHESSHQNR